MAELEAPATTLPIVQYWHAAEQPDYIVELVATFGDQNPGLPHVVFDEATAEAFIGEHFGGREVAAFRACAVPAMQADYLRYCAVLTLGGVYSDVDVRCVAPFAPLIAATPGGRLFNRANRDEGTAFLGSVINGFFIFGKPGHPFLRLALEVATANIASRSVESVWTTTGPGIFTALLLLRRLGSFDAFMERSAPARWAPAARQLCETVGDQERIATAFEGIEISPWGEARTVLDAPGFELPYKQTADHWVRFESSIFR